MPYAFSIRKRETVSYLQYVYDLDFVHQKEGNYIIPTICLCSRFYASKRGKLCHTYSMFMFQILCIRKKESVSYLQCVYDLNLFIRKSETVSCLQYVFVIDFVYLKEGNSMISTVCLWSRFCVSERGKLCYAYNMFIIQKEGSCTIPTVCLCFRLYVSERGKLYMFMFQIYFIVRGNIYIMIVVQNLYIRKRETVSCLQYVYDLDFMHQIRVITK